MRFTSLLLALVLLASPACADSLTGKTPANSYKDILQVPNSNSGVDSTLRTVEDGEGTQTPLKLSTTGVDISSGFRVGGTAVTSQALDFLKGNGYSLTPTDADTARLIEDILANRYDAANWGVKCDGFQVLDIDIANGGAVATSNKFAFPETINGVDIDDYKFEFTNELETTVPITGDVVSHSGKTITLSTTWTGTTITANTGRLTLYYTDNTTPLRNALEDLRDLNKDESSNSLVGRTLVMPSGLCYTAPQTQYRRQLIQGQGVNSTSLFLKSGSHAALLTSENYAALSGNNSTYGNGIAAGTDTRVPVAMGVKDIQLEGNKAGNSTGTNSVVDYHTGMPLILGDVEIGSCDYNCINLYGSTSYAYSQNDRWGAEEGRIDRLFLRNWGNYGIYVNGIHDTMFNFITGYGATGSYGVYTENGGTIRGGVIHIYATGDGRGIYLGSGATLDELYCDFAGCVINSGSMISRVNILAAGYQGITGLEVRSGGDFTTIGEVKWAWYSSATDASIGVDVQSGADGVYIGAINGSITTSPTNGIGIKWRGSFGEFHGFGGNSNQTGAKCVDMGGTYNVASWTGFGCKTHWAYTVGGYNDMTVKPFHSALETDVSLVSGFLAHGDNLHFANAERAYDSFGGQITSHGNAPTMGTCGTSPAVSGTDLKGVITTGTASPTACTLNFNKAYASAPVCVATTSDAASVPSVTAVSTSAVTFTLSAGLTSGKIYYHCIQ